MPAGSRLLLRAFSIIARRRLRKAFRAVRLLHPERLRSATSGPIIVYLNHPSWWDPLVCIELARDFMPGRIHRAPIDTSALKQYGFFRHLGMFPVEQGTPRGALQFVRAAQSVLAANGVLWITAQGHFTDARLRPTHLMPGLGALLHRTANVTVIPLALEYTFWHQRLPEVLGAVGETLHVETVRDRSASGWTHILEQHLQTAQDILADASCKRRAEDFITILEGRRGTTGLYGAWQHIRERSLGHRYDPDHLASRAHRPVRSPR